MDIARVNGFAGLRDDLHISHPVHLNRHWEENSTFYLDGWCILLVSWIKSECFAMFCYATAALPSLSYLPYYFVDSLAVAVSLPLERYGTQWIVTIRSLKICPKQVQHNGIVFCHQSNSAKDGISLFIQHFYQYPKSQWHMTQNDMTWRDILLIEEILHHLRCIKLCKSWDRLPINWCKISSINSIITSSRTLSGPCYQWRLQLRLFGGGRASVPRRTSKTPKNHRNHSK